MTVNCARCHNHKFDPILQADFYSLQAVFAGAKGKEVEIATPDEKAAWEAAEKAYKERLAPIEEALKALAKPYEEQIREERKAQARPQAARSAQHAEGQADSGAEASGRRMPRRRSSRPGTKWSR